MERLSDVDIKNMIGKELDLLFMVKKVELKKFKNRDGEYMQVSLGDKNVNIDAKIWNVTPEVKEKVKVGCIYEGRVSIESYNNNASCILKSMAAVTVENPGEFVNKDERRDKSIEIVKNALNILEGSVYGEIANELLTTYWDKFTMWVGGKSHHHTDIGALIVHTANVAKTSLEIAKYYMSVYGSSVIDVELLLCGCILHDIGKVREMNVDIANGVTEYSDESALQTHITMGLQEIERVAIKKGLENTKEVKYLEHLILSHHGDLEFGSPITPNMIEAKILSTADRLDAEMWRANNKLKEADEDKAVTQWSSSGMYTIYKRG